MSSTLAHPEEPFVIVPQTKIAFIGYLLLFVAQVLLVLQNNQNIESRHYVFSLVYILSAILGLYVINCTVLGKCNLYAWIMGYILLIIGILVVLTIIMQMI